MKTDGGIALFLSFGEVIQNGMKKLKVHQNIKYKL
jgi:hypothetical protein